MLVEPVDPEVVDGEIVVIDILKVRLGKSHLLIRILVDVALDVVAQIPLAETLQNLQGLGVGVVTAERPLDEQARAGSGQRPESRDFFRKNMPSGNPGIRTSL